VAAELALSLSPGELLVLTEAAEAVQRAELAAMEARLRLSAVVDTVLRLRGEDPTAYLFELDRSTGLMSLRERPARESSGD
jgi:hypothetical protein